MAFLLIGLFIIIPDQIYDFWKVHPIWLAKMAYASLKTTQEGRGRCKCIYYPSSIPLNSLISIYYRLYGYLVALLLYGHPL